MSAAVQAPATFDEPTRFQLRFMCDVMNALATSIITQDPPPVGAREAAEVMIRVLTMKNPHTVGRERAGARILATLLPLNAENASAHTAWHWVEATTRMVDGE